MAADAREALRRSYTRLIPYADDITVTARPEITYWQSPRPDALLNTVWYVNAEEADYPQLIEEVNRAHQGRPSSWKIEEEEGPLPQLLAEAGYSIEYCAQGFWIESNAVLPSSPDIIVKRVTTPAQLKEFGDVDAKVWGDGVMDPHEHAAIARACFGPNAKLRCFLAYSRSDPGTPIACGRLYLFDDLGFGLIQADATLPHARGNGAFSTLLEARLRHARDHGISRVGLYAMENTSAPIVERRGFHRCGSLTNWSRAAPGGDKEDG